MVNSWFGNSFPLPQVNFADHCATAKIKPGAFAFVFAVAQRVKINRCRGNSCTHTQVNMHPSNEVCVHA